jgi:hypothetical protein
MIVTGSNSWKIPCQKNSLLWRCDLSGWPNYVWGKEEEEDNGTWSSIPRALLFIPTTKPWMMKLVTQLPLSHSARKGLGKKEEKTTMRF